MRQWALGMAVLLAGCVEEEDVRPTRVIQRVQLSVSEPPPGCRPLDAVEVRSGQRDPTTHEVLSEYAAERGANYVVLDSFAVLDARDDIFAVTRARLFSCPVSFVGYGCPPRVVYGARRAP
jgi:hypothetical protein